MRAWLAFVMAIALSACDDEDPASDGGREAVDAARSPAEDAAARDGGSRDGGARDGGVRDGASGSADGGVRDGSAGGCAAAEIVIEERCSPFGACGGALALGAYCYDGLCIEEEELLAPLLPYCATIRVVAATGSITGRVSLREGSRLERASLAVVEVTTLFPASCVVNGCDEVETLVERELPSSTATCAMTDECRCEVSIRTAIELTGSYTANPAAGTLRVGSGVTERAYDYCVGADGSVRLRARPGGSIEPGIQSIAPDA